MYKSKISCNFALQSPNQTTIKYANRPVRVQAPSTYNANMEFLQERVSRFAQALIDDTIANNRPHRIMSLKEIEEK